MSEKSHINSRIFYSILGISLLVGVLFFGFDFFKNYYLIIGFFFLFGIIPILIISLMAILINNFRKLGFLNGVKESSLLIFSLIICSLILWKLYSFTYEKNNKINVTVINQTEKGISNIQLIGRNAKTKIDTLAPKQSVTFIFKGKRINYQTENDYENEIRLLYYYENKWRENKVLGGFARWKVISNNWKIKIHSADSINLVELL